MAYSTVLQFSILVYRFSYSIDLTPLVKAYVSGREPDYVTSVLDCATGLQYKALDAVVNVLVEGLGKRATLVAVKPFVEQCVSGTAVEPKACVCNVLL